MNSYVEVEFRSGKLGYFNNSRNLALEPDMKVIVEVDRGFDIATVVHSSIWSEELDVQHKNNKILKLIKVAQEQDIKQIDIVREKELSAGKKFLNVLEQYPFEMKLIETIYQFDGNKLTFYFTADGRIDFRDFVKELASIFRTRIELHQSTGRDEAKRLSGIGVCGYKYCCASFLKRFNQVTIQMVKDQNLSSNLSKISGPCGRLLCCLKYEEDYYEEFAKEFPEFGESLQINGKEMYVYKNDFCKKEIHLTNDQQMQEVISLEQYNALRGKLQSHPGRCPKGCANNKRNNDRDNNK